jgi:hypothetical protein
MPARKGTRRTGPATRTAAVVIAADGKKAGSITPGAPDLSRRSLGATSIGFTLRGAADEAMLARVPVTAQDMQRIDPGTARVFRVDGDTFEVIWHSGVNLDMGFAWARVDRPGTYAVIGLPRDIVLHETLRELALNRRLAPPGASLGRGDKEADPFLALALRPLLETDDATLNGLRRQIAATIASVSGRREDELTRGNDGAIEPSDLRIRGDELKKQVARLQVGAAGLPEEQLFFDPNSVRPAAEWRPAGWPLPLPWPEPLPRPIPLPWPIPWPPFDPRPWLPWWRFFACDWFPWWWRCWRFCWIWPRDWWMYHHDEAHSGAASGCSGITSTSVGGLIRRSALTLAGVVDSMPAIVGGKVFVGTGNSSLALSSSGGTVYRIDAATGAIEATFTFNTPVFTGSRQGRAGVGSSVAVSGGRVYVSGLDGKLYCLDAWLNLQWVTDLRNRDLAHRQPVQNGSIAEGWSSPVVAGGRVFVGFGEGETNCFGFVYGVDAVNGSVDWLFCTNQFTPGVDNLPNEIPSSTASGLPAGWAAANGFTVRADPAQRGASPWSSACYDAGLDRIYIGTGNAVPDDPLPDPRYASGLLALDATTGQFRGYFQPSVASSYRPNDDDVDVPAGPTLYSRGGTRYVGIGSKNGSFFVLDAATLVPVTSRQLLPYDALGGPFPAVDPHGGPGENYYGVFASAAVHASSGRLFVGLGGYSASIDNVTTPFIRALDWATLADAWPTTGANPPKYSAATPPVYSTPGETGLSSPGVVNDVVFMGTTKPGFYALAVADGHCLWSAGPLGGGGGAFVMGPAISGNYVVAASGSILYIWSL